MSTLYIIFSAVILFVTIVCREVSSSKTWWSMKQNLIHEHVWNWEHFMHWCRLHWMIFFIDGIARDNIKLLWRNTRAQWTNPPKWHVDMTCTQVILEPFFYLWRFGKFLISPQACIRASLLTTYGRVVNFENWFDSWTFSELTLVCHEHETMKELYY